MSAPTAETIAADLRAASELLAKVAQALPNLAPRVLPPEPKRYTTKEAGIELGRLLGLKRPVSHVYLQNARKRARNPLGFFRHGRIVTYSQQHLDDFAASCERNRRTVH